MRVRRRWKLRLPRPIGLSEIANHTGVTVLFPVSCFQQRNDRKKHVLNSDRRTSNAVRSSSPTRSHAVSILTSSRMLSESSHVYSYCIIYLRMQQISFYSDCSFLLVKDRTGCKHLRVLSDFAFNLDPTPSLHRALRFKIQAPCSFRYLSTPSSSPSYPLASGIPAPISSETPDPNALPTLGVTVSGAGNDSLTTHGLTKRQTGAHWDPLAVWAN